MLKSKDAHLEVLLLGRPGNGREVTNMPQMIPACFKWKLPVFSDDD